MKSVCGHFPFVELHSCQRGCPRRPSKPTTILHSMPEAKSYPLSHDPHPLHKTLLILLPKYHSSLYSLLKSHCPTLVQALEPGRLSTAGLLAPIGPQHHHQRAPSKLQIWSCHSLKNTCNKQQQNYSSSPGVSRVLPDLVTSPVSSADNFSLPLQFPEVPWSFTPPGLSKQTPPS